MISHLAFYMLLILDILYLAYCIYLIKHPSPYVKKKLDEMERRFNEGDILGNKDFFRKKPWYITEKVEIIRYTRLKSMYSSHVGEIPEAYHEAANIPHEWLYEDEIPDFITTKAMLLWNMGDFSAAVKVMEEADLSNTAIGHMLLSFVAEYSGDFDTAYLEMKAAKNCITIQEVDPAYKVQIYHNYGRIELICGNRLEALSYMQMACTEVPKLQPVRMDLVHICFSQFIFNLALDADEKYKVDDYIKKYHDLIKNESIDNLIEFNNCKISYYRQLHDSEATYRGIKDGYDAVMSKIADPEQRALYQVSTFRMLMNGEFVHDWLDADIEKEYKGYENLSPGARLAISKEFMGILHLPDFYCVKNQSPYKQIYNRVTNYYKKGKAQKDIDECLSKLDAHEIVKRCRLLQNQLSVLKHVERECHISKSKEKYLNLHKTWMEAGFRIDATNTLMILADECMSSFNVVIQPAPWMPYFVHQDFLDMLSGGPAPQLMSNGFQLKYSKYIPDYFKVIPQKKDVLEEMLEILMPEVESWKSHPAKYEYSIHIAHYLMGLGRRDEAKKFYLIFKESKISIEQYALWMRQEVEILDAEFEVEV